MSTKLPPAREPASTRLPPAREPASTRLPPAREPASTRLPMDTVLKPTPWCVVREQEDQHLVYNSRTDELHLLPPTGLYAYRLCNGYSTIEEIGEDLAATMPDDRDALYDRLREFFGMLVARGILEVDS